MIFGYLNDYAFEIDAPQHLLVRLAEHMEPASGAQRALGSVTLVETGDILDFAPRADTPYLEIIPNRHKSVVGFDYIRYGIHAKSLWQMTPRSFLIESRLRTDEMSVLDSMRDLWFCHPGSRGMALMHACCVVVDGCGLLVVGSCRSGKTTLAVRLLSEVKNVQVVSEGITLLASVHDTLVAHYVPRPLYIRFGTCFACQQLEHAFLRDILRCDSTQTLDRDTIARIISRKARKIDLSLNVARHRFCEAFGASSVAAAPVSRVVFVEYRDSSECTQRELDACEAFSRLKETEFPKTATFGRIERQPNITPPASSHIERSWLQGVSAVELTYAGWHGLNPRILAQLLN